MKKEAFIKNFAKELEKQTGIKANKVSSENMPTFRVIADIADHIFTFEAPFNGLTKKFIEIQADKINQMMKINSLKGGLNNG